jgi:hypothetical protein
MRAARTLSSPPDISATAFLLKKTPDDLSKAVNEGTRDENNENNIDAIKIPEACC